MKLKIFWRRCHKTRIATSRALKALVLAAAAAIVLTGADYVCLGGPQGTPGVYRIALAAGVPTAYTTSYTVVASNADTGALLNALMPTPTLNPKGVRFNFDLGAYPFATQAVHDTPTIKNASNVVTSLAPLVIHGQGDADPQDNNEPQKINGVVFYPTSAFTTGTYLIRINPSGAAGRFAFGPIIEGVSILCTTDGAATFEPFTDATSQSAGIQIINPSAGHFRDVWVGSPTGSGIAGIAVNTVGFAGGGFVVDHCWVNALKGTGNYAFMIDLSDCAVTNSFAYFTAPGNTDWRLGYEDGTNNRYIGHVRVNGGGSGDCQGTVFEFAGTATVTGFSQNGNTTQAPSVLMKKTGRGDVVVSGCLFKDPLPGGASIFQYSGGATASTTTITGTHFDNLTSNSTIVNVTTDVPAAELITFSADTLTGSGIGSLQVLNGHTGYVVPTNLRQQTITSNIAGVATTQHKVLTSSASSIAFTVPPGYTNARITVSGQGTAAAGTADLRLQFNGDAGNNYQWHFVESYANTAPGAASGTSAAFIKNGSFVAATGQANAPSSCVIDVPNYYGATFYKVATSRMGWYSNGVGGQALDVAAGTWFSTSAITSSTLSLSSGSFAAGTVATLTME